MAEQIEYSGFFNAQESGGTYDRVYDASDFAEYFALFIGNGVFVNPMNQLKVVPKDGLTVTLKKGNAFIDGYWYKLTEDMDFTLSPNGTSYAITDVIAITLDKTNRIVTAKKKEQVSSIVPVDNGTVHELIVASISLGAGVSSITEAMITDQRPFDEYCGFVTGTVDQIDASEMFTQLEAQFDEWFETIKGQLGQDAATNLQLQINELKEQSYLLVGGTEITSGTNLNNLKTVGNYYYKKAESSSLVNAPENEIFTMKVFDTGAGVIGQRVLLYDAKTIYTRYVQGEGWTEWAKVGSEGSEWVYLGKYSPMQNGTSSISKKASDLGIDTLEGKVITGVVIKDASIDYVYENASTFGTLDTCVRMIGVGTSGSSKVVVGTVYRPSSGRGIIRIYAKLEDVEIE